ncbi:tail fiber domain-containing protein [Erwinia aphidicola]|uniref:Tail fiber domain-containing protein n=1 Tax=Erwinia aphidicola TaxID=68334 RepID=A0ABU8DGQ3_ERWAP
MPAGTIALTNNSATVGGTGTAFTTELKAGDFIGVTVGGAPYTMIVASIASNTQLTIAQAYNGPTASGLAWYGIPATLKYAITQQVLNDMATNQRGMIAQLANWQKIYSDAASVTVERPDRSTFTGPSWGYMATQYANKADLVSGAVSIGQGGTGARTATLARDALGLAYGSSAGTVTQGNDARLGTLDGKSGGSISSNVNLLSGSRLYFSNSTSPTGNIFLGLTSDARSLTLGGASQTSFDSGYGYLSRQGRAGATGSNVWLMYWTGSKLQSWVDSSNIGNFQIETASDKLLKKDIKYTDDAEKSLEEVLQWKPATFKYRERGVIAESDSMYGVIANDLIEVSPECVKGSGLKEGFDEENPDDPYIPDQMAMIMKLAGAVQGQQKMIDSQKLVIEELHHRLKAVDGLDA